MRTMDEETDSTVWLSVPTAHPTGQNDESWI